MSIISLLSDFGQKDPYVAEMKAVILSINPKVQLIDISHQINKFDIRMGAFILASATPYFPKNTIHLAVVDPGVGTERRSIIIETTQGIYVGPDNGLLMLAAQKSGIKKVYVINDPKYSLQRISKTFHGRDIFAPAAAFISKGIKPSDFGSEIQNHVIPSFIKPKIKKHELIGEVIHIDDFGNIITNIRKEDLDKIGINIENNLRLKFKDQTLTLRYCSTYSEVSIGKPLMLLGGTDFIEISLNRKNAFKF